MRNRQLGKKALSMLLCLSLLLTYTPSMVMAAENDDLCPHHQEHTEDCGYVEGESTCGYVCEECEVTAVDAPEENLDEEPEEKPAEELEMTDTQNGDISLYADSNVNTVSVDGCAHVNYTNGFCDDCDAYEPAVLSDGIYEISNAGQLYWFAAQVNSGAGKNYNAKLTKDITVNSDVLKTDGTLNGDGSNFRVWIPISNRTTDVITYYYATFDGNGHSVSGLYYHDADDSYIGLFGYIQGGNVKNVAVVDSWLYGKENVGGIVGCCDSNSFVQNCYNCSSVSAVKDYVGGIAGYAKKTTITNCFNAGLVRGENYVGSVLGYNWADYSTVSNCYYLSGTAVRADGKTQNALGSSWAYNSKADEAGKTVGRTASELSNGEVVWLLNGKSSTGIWKQTIGTDNYPNFTGETVYAASPCPVEFSNTQFTEEKAHDYDTKGVCKACGSACSHEFNEEHTCPVCGYVCTHESFADGKCILCGCVCTHEEMTDGYCAICGYGEEASVSDDVYQIQTLGNLMWFAQQVRSGSTDISGKVTADINAKAAKAIGIGSGDNPFTGTFDGDGHTITIGLSGGENTALFPVVNGATIQNLTLAGSLDVSGGKFAGSFIGSINDGNVTLKNCLSTVTITSAVSGDGTHGGLVGVANKGSLTIENCGFAGTLTGGNTTSCGGMIGWANGSCTTTIKNSYVAAGFGVNSTNCNTFTRNAGSHVTLTNCYYLTALNETPSGATQKSAEQFKSGEVTYLLNAKVTDGSQTWYQTIGTDDYPKFSGKTVYCDDAAIIYTNESVQSHSFNVNGFCTDEECDAYEPAVLKDDRYEISNAGQLFWFAKFVNNGNSKASAVLLKDIDLENREWTPIGHYSDSKPDSNSNLTYEGTFDGQGHTICNLNVNVTSTYEAGMFSRTYKATLKNFGVINATVTQTQNIRAGVIAGEIHQSTLINVFTAGTITITTDNVQAGGIGGECASSTLTNCYTTFGVLTAKTSATVTNCYYMADAANENSVGTNMTETRFKSGEVTYMLNSAVTDGSQTWYQTIGTDDYPKFTGGTVYCIGSAYTNTDGHYYDNGFCTDEDCDEYEPATLKGEVYEISNAGQLYWFAEQVNSGNNKISGKLMDDIRINEDVLAADGSLNSGTFRTWTPIGGQSNAYGGTFEGNNKTVNGMYLNDGDKSYVGLFGYVGNGIVQNITIADSYFAGSIYVGGLAGKASDEIITNCHNSGTVTAKSVCGGLVGYALGTTVISNCHNNGLVGNKGCVGGLVGANGATIRNCYNSGTLNCTFESGGIAAYNYSGAKIENCYNTGTITATGYSIGSMVGVNNGTITNCYYLMGCAVIDGVTQLGVGNATKGETTADVEGQTAGMSSVQFKSGEAAYMLNSAVTDGSQAWYQTVGIALPDFTGKTVYRYTNCKGTVGYANEARTDGHQYDNGFCTDCGEYEPAVLNGDVYEISNAGQLYWFARLVNVSDGTTDKNPAANGRLMKDITVNSEYLVDGKLTEAEESSPRKWTPIGTADTPYTGTFDGDNHTVSTLYIIASSNNQGMFGVVKSGLVKDFTVSAEIVILDDNNEPVQRVGGVVGWAYDGATVSGVTSNAKIYESTESVPNINNRYIGGVVGYLGSHLGNDGIVTKATVQNCVFGGTIKISKAQQLGGVVGISFNSTVTNCENRGTVTATDLSNHVAGIVAAAHDSTTVTYCINNGDVSSGGYDCIGGVVAYANAGTKIEYCANLKTVTCTGENGGYIGGVLGYIRNSEFGSLKSCYNYGSIITNDGSDNHAGAIVGWCRNDSSHVSMIVNNCYLESSYTAASNGTEVTATAKNADEFSSGEVAYLLNGDTEGDAQVWKQTLNTDVYPNFTGKTVYKNTKCDGTVVYDNEEITYEHNYVNGFCKYCDEYEACKGSGTAEEPYEIANGGNLYWFAEQVNSGNNKIYGKLTDNIIVNENVLVDGVLNSNTETVEKFRVWVPIGGRNSGKYTFYGSFDGDNHTVSGLYFDDSTVSYVGLFGYTAGYIRNVGIIGSYLHGCNYVGGIVGSIVSDTYSSVEKKNSDVTNCFNASVVVAEKDRYSTSYVGGVMGYALNVTVINCYNAGSVIGAAGYVGGIIGYGSECTVADCHNNGVITSNSGYNAGGIAGKCESGTITNCYNTEKVFGYTYTGGIVGCLILSSEAKSGITDCYNTGSVTSKADMSYAGGVAGYVHCNAETVAVDKCYNNGEVSGNDYVGGVAGYLNWDAEVHNCYNLNTVTGKNGIGGVVGNVSTNCKVTDSHNIGTVSGTAYVGGIVGKLYEESASVTNCYYMTGCATDGSPVVQFGIGNETQGEATEDKAESTVAKTSGEFKSGEVTYLLNGNTEGDERVWKQTIDTDDYPNFTGKTVYFSKDNVYINDGIYSATITWGAMEFTYTDGTWSTATHAYSEGKWTAEGNTVTVENTGTVAVTASVAYKNEEGFNFDASWDKESAQLQADALEVTFTLTISGKPETELNDKKIGNVTVGIK